jgi:hypothetical protein
MLEESRFTAASDQCPHPEYWHSADGDATEFEVSELVGAFVSALQPDVVVETGTHLGHTAATIGRALNANGHGRLTTFEPDPGRAESAVRRCAAWPVTVRIRSSLADQWDGGPIGFAWFDSLLNLRVPEFWHYRPHMIAGRTIVGFHDTADHHPLWPEVSMLESIGAVRLIRLPTPRGVVFAEVK